jgi:hypothetical protein
MPRFPPCAGGFKNNVEPLIEIPAAALESAIRCITAKRFIPRPGIRNTGWMWLASVS